MTSLKQNTHTAKPACQPTTCEECQSEWPIEPERPTFKHGCAECKREYHRRYNRQPSMQAAKRADYEKHAESRRQKALDKYHAEGKRYAKHGITREQFLEMYTRQEGCCAICNRSVSEAKAHIDHDHETGRIRGLLCMNCSRALGYFADNKDALMRAINYLTEKE